MKNRSDGSIALFIGKTRSGKSVPLKRAVESLGRALAFDPKGEYTSQLGYERITTPEELMRRCQEVGPGNARLAFFASDPKSYDFFCGVALIWNMYKPIVAICEELAAVTNSGKSSGNWNRLTNQGLAYGIIIMATVQRGQEVDKTLMGAASFVHVTMHGIQDDRDYIAGKLGVSVDEVPNKPLEFLQWTSDLGVVVRGTVDFPASKKTKNWPEGVPRFREKGGKRRLLTIGTEGRFKQVKYR